VPAGCFKRVVQAERMLLQAPRLLAAEALMRYLQVWLCDTCILTRGNPDPPANIMHIPPDINRIPVLFMVDV
jgi:hypothetical protein